MSAVIYVRSHDAWLSEVWRAGRSPGLVADVGVSNGAGEEFRVEFYAFERDRRQLSVRLSVFADGASLAEALGVLRWLAGRPDPRGRTTVADLTTYLDGLGVEDRTDYYARLPGGVSAGAAREAT